MRWFRRRFRPTVKTWDPGYAAQVSEYIGSPGPPEDHVHGDWWASGIVAHLNASHFRLIAGPWGEAGVPFEHTLACPKELAVEEHIACHEAGQDHSQWFATRGLPYESSEA